MLNNAPGSSMLFLAPLLLLSAPAFAAGSFIAPPLCVQALSALPESARPIATHTRMDFSLQVTETDQSFDPFRGATISVETMRVNAGNAAAHDPIFDSLRVFINDTTGRKPLPAYVVLGLNSQGQPSKLHILTAEAPWIYVNEFPMSDFTLTLTRPLKSDADERWDVQLSANGGTRLYRADVLKRGYREVELDRRGNALKVGGFVSKTSEDRPLYPTRTGRPSQRPPRRDPSIVDHSWNQGSQGDGGEGKQARSKRPPTLEFIIQSFRSLLNP